MVVPVSMIGSIVMFSIGGVIGHIGPRLPTLYMTRAKGFNVNFPPHPHPIPLSPYLTQRVLHMRSFYWSSMVLAIITLIFGAVSLKWGSAPFGFGLWVATSWMVLSRLQNAVGGTGAPWTREIAYGLQKIMDQAASSDACCDDAEPVWLPGEIACSECGMMLDPRPRPDLGRPRKDGKLMGSLRMLISDGYPLAAPPAIDTTSEE
jgi:hypothetical protein